ncbi:hypothetical protein FH972_000613 [Carpinus fangiana]|uniref:Uncharacterized protein n=1 Tax=Carpinus fangiana TaxID=176857 RepID=A0A5N6Q9B8_9ROSI|nr:hypothetical protein FH972_000613 [Carpinus fangiana]
MPAHNNIVHFHEFPEIILFNIFSLVSDIRTRNTMSLVMPQMVLARALNLHFPRSSWEHPQPFVPPYMFPSCHKP